MPRLSYVPRVTLHFSFVGPSQTDEIVPLFRELEEYYFGDDAASLADIRNYIENRMFADTSGVQVVLAKNDSGDVVGFATISLLHPAPALSGQMYMKDLFTSAAARGTGVGKALMQFIARYALDQGCSRLDWTAESTNPSAGDFYDAIGADRITEKQYFRFEGDSLEHFASGSPDR